ncbi:Oligosaccharyl transferase STT3 subunit-domain-containing protein [Pelagophyceae sp. CCMP2097]|nr:Oligosaccharyl transferase STT3 subunit-domain-containing protein [Pelagophyceae sp. CCMP2097]
MAEPKAESSVFGGFSGHVARGALLLLATHNAYHIRMFAIHIYGNVIHEFDPWFNYRATEYLAQNGIAKFFTWFDYRAWYPLGRPVGTTIYPGMQLTSVAIWRALGAATEPGAGMSLNDVCVYVPVWFGVAATALLALLTYECSRSLNAAVAAALIMAVIPAHLMRSVGGGYDNESVAMTAMCLVFWLWCRSLRNDAAWPLGALAGLAYVNMVAAWGGFIFVLNMIGCHAALLVLLGRYRPALHKAYSLWYVIGTLGAMHVPVVGWAPVRSLEQLAPGLLFLAMQLIAATEYVRTTRKGGCTRTEAWRIRVAVFGAAAAAGAAVFAALFFAGYFGPISSRVRGLFVRHTRTGNPLVDSVAEHQPASSDAYWHYLHYTVYAAPVGMAVLAASGLSDAKLFIGLYATFAYFFSSKMVRLIIFLGPVASALAGVALGATVDLTAPLLIDALMGVATGGAADKPETADDDKAARRAKKAADKAADDDLFSNAKPAKGAKAQRKPPVKVAPKRNEPDVGTTEGFVDHALGLTSAKAAALTALQPFAEALQAPRLKVARTVAAAALLAAAVHYYKQFSDYSWSLAEGMSQPSIMFRATLRDGTPVMVDDYREAYWWLRDHTPDDARVMAWWDYGYQISGIANRTTLADGNTWNHEHIATLGRCLTSPEKSAHRIVRHLADYVLVWAGGGGDDLAKSPHMARIGNSVFRDICPDDPTCTRFGFMDRQGTPTPMMAASLLYKLHSHGQKPGVQVDSQLFREVYTSRFNKVRIFKVLKVSQKSKRWVADPANRNCDAPGSWYCKGDYPPALQSLVAQRKNFAQLEDFNRKRDDADSTYTQEYMARMNGQQRAAHAAVKAAESAYFEIEDEVEAEDVDADDALPDAPGADIQAATQAQYAADAARAQAADWAAWSDTDDSTRMWGVVSSGSVAELEAWIAHAPAVVHMRAADGRGPLWWAYENDQPGMVDALVAYGADADATDARGMKPRDLKN